MALGIRFIWIGKLKKPYWAAAQEHYWKRLSRYHQLEEITLKDAPAHLPGDKKAEQESRSIQSRLSSRDISICLDSRGQALSSVKLAQCLQDWTQDRSRKPCFIIGGSFGLTESLLQSSSKVLSFGPMTLPHELARIILLEQLYRAATLNSKHPYHH
jgi:23S rRNA (pseudouridine1915-N3)-methyltransferase